MKKTKLRIASVLVGLLATVALLGPFVFESIFGLIVDYVPVMVKVTVSIVFVLVNAVAHKLEGKTILKWVCVILSVVMTSFWMDSIILGWITAWKNCTAVRTASIVMFAIAAIVNIIDFVVDRKKAEAE